MESSASLFLFFNDKLFYDPFNASREPFKKKYTEITEKIRRHRTVNILNFSVESVVISVPSVYFFLSRPRSKIKREDP